MNPARHRFPVRGGTTILLVLLASATGSVTPVHAQQRLVLVGVTLLDGTGAAPVSGARIIVDGDRFTCVSGPVGCPARPSDRELSLAGQWITPGLINTHVHLPITQAPDSFPRLQRLRFALGITTVRDADSGFPEAILAERPDAADGSRPYPRLVVAARVTPEYADRLGVRLGAPLVERLAAMGVDAIKIKEPYDSDLWREVIRAARAADLPVYGHTWAGGPPPHAFLRQALREGIDGVSHTMAFPLEGQPGGIDLTSPDTGADPWIWHMNRWLTANPAVLDTLITEMIDHGVWLEPTLAVDYHWSHRPEPPDPVRFLGPARRLRAMIGLGEPTVATGPFFPEPWARQAAFVGEFIRRGGIVVAGSDGPRPGLDLHEEIRLIGEVAGSPMAGLVAATRNAAQALHRPDLGTIEAGKLADAVVYPADPLGTPNATLAVLMVLKGGVIHHADTLRAEFQAEYDARVRDAWRGRAIRGLKLLGIVMVCGILAGIVWTRFRRRR